MDSQPLRLSPLLTSAGAAVEAGLPGPTSARPVPTRQHGSSRPCAATPTRRFLGGLRGRMCTRHYPRCWAPGFRLPRWRPRGTAEARVRTSLVDGRHPGGWCLWLRALPAVNGLPSRNFAAACANWSLPRWVATGQTVSLDSGQFDTIIRSICRAEKRNLSLDVAPRGHIHGLPSGNPWIANP